MGQPGRAGRGPTQEELPLSTRVHELAKELGLKSQELLDRIQNWGLDVKASPLASLDSSTVDRIKELHAAPRGPAPRPEGLDGRPATPEAGPGLTPYPSGDARH